MLIQRVKCDAAGCKNDLDAQSSRASEYEFHVCGEECFTKFVLKIMREKKGKIDFTVECFPNYYGISYNNDNFSAFKIRDAA